MTRALIWVATVVGASVIMAATMAVIAVVPDMARDLEASQSEAQLIIDATAVMLGALVLPTGALLDRYGRRRGLVIGFAGMIAALIWCSVAQTPLEMIFARLAVGGFAAIAFPGTLVTLTATTPPEKRSLAVAAWAGAIMIGGTYGLLIAGACAQWGDWQTLFYALGAITAVCLVAALIAVPETRDPDPPCLDPVGALLSFVGIGAVILAVVEMPVKGIDAPIVAFGLLGGTAALVLFVLWELRVAAPMLDVRLFRNTTFSTATCTAALLYFATYGWFFLAFQYYVYAMGYSPLGAALGLIPNALVTIPCTVAGASLAKRYGWRRVVVFALLVGAVSFLAIALAGQTFSLLPIALGFALFGVCLGLPQGPVTEAIVDALPRSQQGLASAVNDASRELGAAFGIAVWGSVFNAAYRAHVDGFEGVVLPELLAVIKDSPAAGLQATQRPPLVDLIEQSVANGWTAAFLVGALTLFVAAGLVQRFGPVSMFVAEPAPATAVPIATETPAVVVARRRPRRRFGWTVAALVLLAVMVGVNGATRG